MHKFQFEDHTNLTAPHPSLKHLRVLIRQPILAGVAIRLQAIGAAGPARIARVQILKDPEKKCVS